MSYTMYTPLNVWLDPASVTDVVAYIQTYLSENTIYSETEIETIIHDYLIAHPELIGGVQSVNGKTGVVVLSASDINTENNVTIESVLASLSSQISSIAASVATNTNNITSLTGRMTTAETDLTNLKSSLFTTKSISGNPIEILRAQEGSKVELSAVRKSASVSSAALFVSGRNLGAVRNIRDTSNGITFTYNDNGSVTCNGTASSNAYTGPAVSAESLSDLIAIPAGTYTLSGINEEADIRIAYNVVDSNKTELITAGNIRPSTPTFTFTVDVPAYVYLRILVPSGNTVTNATVYPMLEVGTDYHGFEAVNVTTLDAQFTSDTVSFDDINVISPYMCIRSNADIELNSEYIAWSRVITDEFDSLESRVTALESRVTALESRVTALEGT